MTSNIIYVGVKARVAAIDKATGQTLWQTKLKVFLAASGDSFVTLLVQHGFVYAHSYGQLYCLDAATGEILWQNELEGFGYGIASMAVEGLPSSILPAVAAQQMKQAAGASAATVATGH